MLPYTFTYSTYFLHQAFHFGCLRYIHRVPTAPHQPINHCACVSTVTRSLYVFLSFRLFVFFLLGSTSWSFVVGCVDVFSPPLPRPFILQAPVHLFCGMWGLVATALFTTKEGWALTFGPDLADECCGLFYGCGAKLLVANLSLLASILAWVGMTSTVLFWTIEVSKLKWAPAIRRRNVVGSCNCPPTFAVEISCVAKKPNLGSKQDVTDQVPLHCIAVVGA